MPTAVLQFAGTRPLRSVVANTSTERTSRAIKEQDLTEGS